MRGLVAPDSAPDCRVADEATAGRRSRVRTVLLGAIGSVALLIMGLVGGCMVPRLAMSPAMQRLGLCVPHGWALDGYYAALVKRQQTNV